MSENNTFTLVAKTFSGLEEVLARELATLGALNVRQGTRMVEFEGDKAMMYKANLCCRTALRILKPICKFSASNPDELYDMVREYDWERLLSPDKTFCIDSTVNSSEFPHSQYVTYRVKDGIADYFNDKYGRRPSIRLQGADVMLNVHISGTQITISLDSSGEVLSKRGYRQEQTEAPINEVLAAGIIMLSGWDGQSPLVDPMCGSGTFLIEAALIALNINPGIYRKNFAFEKWPDFDAELFEEIYNDDTREREFNYKIYGADIAGSAVAIARRNVRAANLEKYIEVECRAFEDWTDVPEGGMLITNPPYGERLKPANIEDLYHNIGSTLKQHFQGYKAWILGYGDENFRQIGLRPSIKLPLLNGSLECELREYVMFNGSMDEYRRAGGDMDKKRKKEGDNPVRIKHMSDKEWEHETRKFGPRRKAGKHPTDRQERNSRKKFTKGEQKRSSRADHRDLSEKPWERSQRYNPKRMADINDRGPQISEDMAYVISKTHMRSRRKKQNNE